MDKQPKVLIVPCSGIGKPYGTVSREAAYEVVEVLRPQATQLLALSRLVMGQEEVSTLLKENPVVTLDGCKLACARKMVQENGGTIARDFAVLEVYRRHREYKPRGIAELNEGGMKLARVLAEEVSQVVDWILDGSPAGPSLPIGENQEKP